MHANMRIFFCQLPHELLQKGCCQPTGGNRYLFFQTVIPRCIGQRFREFLLQQAKHPHSVFQLDVSVVVVLLRKLALRQKVPLVAGMDKMCAMHFHALFLPAVDQIQHLTGILLCKRLQRIQPLPEFRQSHRND